jgi:flagellum-specific peptidoglycan hydrolase FlgJ
MDKEAFIQKVTEKVRKYAPLYGICVHSPIIAQAIIESGWGSSVLASRYNNYFGLKCGSSWKGDSVNMATREEYKPGVMTNIRDNFRTYENFDAGIRGYFEFISYSRYANLKGVTNPREYCEKLKSDGYATSSAYVNTLMRVIQENNLTKFDNSDRPQSDVDIENLAQRVIKGEFGKGKERKVLLGGNYEKVQLRVNEILGSSKHKIKRKSMK